MKSVHSFDLNGAPALVAAEPDTPLLYVLRNQLGLKGPRFGCGLGQCGACTVHLNGVAVRSCIIPVEGAEKTRIVTLEGLARPAGLETNSAARSALQQAFIDEQALQCGYCINGWVMTAAEILEKEPEADDARLRDGLSGLKCRCGAHMSILRAIKRAAAQLREGKR